MITLKNNSQLNAYISATILINLCCLFLNGYSADLGYWENWTKQLANNGYLGFNGNYPPLYIHWLYIIGKAFIFFEIPIEPNDLCKFLWEFPVLLSHCLLTCIVFTCLQKTNASAFHKKAVMLLTVFNPAILIDGPIWGQIDLLPSSLAICAILINFSNRYSVFMLPLFTIALLTKLQMICFAPIIGVLFFHRVKTHSYGIIFSLLSILFVFLPFIYVNFYKEAFNQAYINTLGQYPVMTMNAANIWILLVGNNTADSIQFLSHLHQALPQKLAHPKYLGIFLYASISFCIFIFGINTLLKNKNNNNKVLIDSVFLAMVSSISFFTLLPAMHERYLFPAVVCSIIYAAISKKYIGYVILLSIASALNMLIILNINGSDIWAGLSVLVTGIFAISLLQLIAGSTIYSAIFITINHFFKIPFSSIIVFFVSVFATFNYLINRHGVNDVELTPNQSLLTQNRILSARQDYGILKFQRSVDNNILSVGNKRFKNGIGTHANSIITYELPKNSIAFDVIPGIDDEVITADVVFEVWEDENLRWRSSPYIGHEKPINIHITLNKGSKLTLKVDSHGETLWDHADWINPIISIEQTHTK